MTDADAPAVQPVRTPPTSRLVSKTRDSDLFKYSKLLPIIVKVTISYNTQLHTLQLENLVQGPRHFMSNKIPQNGDEVAKMILYSVNIGIDISVMCYPI